MIDIQIALATAITPLVYYLGWNKIFDHIKHNWQIKYYLSERLKEVGTRDGDHNVNMMDDEEWLVHNLIWEVCQVVRDEQ